MEQLFDAVRHAEEVQRTDALKSWFVAEAAFLEYFEEVEEEGAYPDLLGKNLVVSVEQYPWLHKRVDEISAFLEIDSPRVFVYESYQHVCDSEGLRIPRLEVSARLLRSFTEDELTHVLAKEIYHLKANHIRLEIMTDKMLGLIGNIPELPGLNIVKGFGGAALFSMMGFSLRDAAFNWFRCACSSAENFAAAYTGNVAASVSATLMSVLNERALVEAVSIPAYIRQTSSIEACQGPAATLEKINESLPYGPYRVRGMLDYLLSPRGEAFYTACRNERERA